MTRFLQISILLVSLCYQTAVGASWQLNPSPTMTNAGIDIKVEYQEYLNTFYRLSDGTPHVIIGFSGAMCQFWDVNLSNGVSRVLTVTNVNQSFVPDPSVGGLPGTCALTSSNTLVITTTAHLGASVYVYNPVSGALTRVGQNTGSSIPGACDEEEYSTCVDPNGVVFMGTFGHAMVDSYNPSNGVFTSWGQLDTNLTGVGNYAYSVSANRNYIYGAIRDGYSWYLGIMERANTNKTLLWKGTSTLVGVSDGTNGSIYVEQITNGAAVWWMFTNTVPVLVTNFSWTMLKSDYYKGNVDRDVNNWGTHEGWDIESTYDLSSASGSIPSASMVWKPHSGTNWTTIVETNHWLTTAGSVDILQPWYDGSLFWVTHAYGPVGTFIPGGLTTILGPYKGTSVRDVLQVSPNEVYLAGYFEQTLRWNPSQPWTRTPLLPDYTSTNYNPYTCISVPGIYQIFLVRGSNGKIFCATRYDRDSVSGQLDWYDPTNGTVGYEHTTFASNADGPNDLKPAEHSTKLVWASYGGNIFIWDAATFTQVTNFTVLGGQPIKKLVEYQNGKMFGISGSNLVAFTTTGTQLYSNHLPATVWGTAQSDASDYQRLTLGPDNYVWVLVNIPTVSTSLYRINPVDGTYTNLLTFSAGPDKIVFNGGDAYLYGSTKIYRIPNLLVPLAPPPILLTGAAKLPNGAFQFAFTNTPVGTNYITTNITTIITTNWSKWGPPKITGYTTNTTPTLTTNGSANTATVLTTTNLLLPLTNWTVLGTVTDNPPGQFQFSDPQATNHPLRFYRVRSP